MSAAHKTNRTLAALGSASGSLLVLGSFIALWWVGSTSGWAARRVPATGSHPRSNSSARCRPRP